MEGEADNAEVSKKNEENKLKRWQKVITQHARINQKWFYLPKDDAFGFEQKMAVDFRIPIRVPREHLKGCIHLRTGRLNDEATAHFRERISEFFRRYPYDEWYPLNKAEFEAYCKDRHPGTEPRDYQR